MKINNINIKLLNIQAFLILKNKFNIKIHKNNILKIEWLNCIVFCLNLKNKISFLHIVCFKIYIKYLGPSWPKIDLPENVDTIWLTIPNPGIIKIYLII